jgi:transposase
MTGRTISEDLKMVAVRLSRAFPVSVVSTLLAISEDTIRRAVNSYHETGEVTHPNSGTARGRKRLLNEEDQNVSC